MRKVSQTYPCLEGGIEGCRAVMPPGDPAQVEAQTVVCRLPPLQGMLPPLQGMLLRLQGMLLLRCDVRERCVQL